MGRADGQVFGHLATWDRPHMSFAGRKIYAPKSPSAYEEFHVGSVLTPAQHTARLPSAGPEPNSHAAHASCFASISAIRASMRVLISSRIGRTESTPLPAGSSRAQSRYFLPGKMGQASPQPMVMT